MLRAAWAEAYGDFEGAVAHARRCVLLEPDLYARSLVESHLIVALLALGRTSEAREEHGIAVAPPLMSPHRHLTDIVEMLAGGVDDPTGAAVRSAPIAAGQVRRHPHTVGDWLLGFGWLAHWRGERDIAMEISRSGMSLFLPSSSLSAAIEGWDPAHRKEQLESYWAAEADGPAKLARTVALFDRELARWRSVRGRG